MLKSRAKQYEKEMSRFDYCKYIWKIVFLSALNVFKYFYLFQENEKINNTLRNKVETFVNMTETISNLTAENARLHTKFESLTAENQDLVQSLQTRIDQVAQLKTELESLKTVNSLIYETI